MIWLKLARQAAAAELNSPSGSTSGGSGSGGYSGGSSGGYTGGGSIGGGNSGGTKSNPAIVRFQRMCKETLGGNVDITGVKDTKTTNAIKYLQAMLSNDRRIDYADILLVCGIEKRLMLCGNG